MTPRQARIALATFVLLSAGVVYNALYLQRDAQSAMAAGETQRAASARVEKQPPSRSRTAQETKRLSQPKPNVVKTSDAQQETRPAEASAETLRAIQRELNERGFGPVAGDGVMRPVTRAAIMSYEHDNRMPLTGEATEALLTHLVLGGSATSEASGAGQVRSPHAEAMIKQVQRLLSDSGYRPGPIDGRLHADTTSAIRAFEQDQGLSPKGRISAEVLTRLQTSAMRLKSAEVN